MITKFFFSLALWALPLSAMAVIKCDSPDLFAAAAATGDPDVVSQMTKAAGEITTSRGRSFYPESHPAYLQLRTLLVSGVRNYEIKTALASEDGLDQIILPNPQLIKISGGGLRKPLYVALPSSINLSESDILPLERRLMTGDPSQKTANDIMISSVGASDTKIIYRQKLIRGRNAANLADNVLKSVSSVSDRTVELRGERVGGQFLVRHLVLKVQNTSAPTGLTQISASLETPLVLITHN